MIHLVRKPTVWTWVALGCYLALLCFAYQEGSYEYRQERDVWIATPFMLAPFFLPLFIRKTSRIFWLCYFVFATYLIATFIFWNLRDWDIGIMLYYIKWAPCRTDEMTQTEYVVASTALNLVVSALYGSIGILAAQTYRLRSAADNQCTIEASLPASNCGVKHA